MAPKYKRDIIGNINKHQEKVLYPFYVCCLFILAGIVLLAYLLLQHPFFSHANDYRALLANQITSLKLIIVGIGFLIVITFFSLIFWAHYISNRILGPFDRIISDLDKVLLGKRKKPLTVRKGDEMFQELLQRVNRLIEKANKAGSEGTEALNEDE